MLSRLRMILCLAMVAGSAASAAAQSAEEISVRQRVESFLARLGNRELDSLAGDFTRHAVIVVTRQREGRFVNSVQPVSEWLDGLRRSPNAQRFEEPLSNVRVTIDSGHLAHLRADFQVIRDGKVVSSGVDHFTLVREPDGWKIAVVAYTSIPAGS